MRGSKGQKRVAHPAFVVSPVRLREERALLAALEEGAIAKKVLGWEGGDEEEEETEREGEALPQLDHPV